MTPLDSPGPKIGAYVQTARNYFSRGPSYNLAPEKEKKKENRRLMSILSQNSLPSQRGSAGEKFK